MFYFINIIRIAITMFLIIVMYISIFLLIRLHFYALFSEILQ